ncbi:MAG: glycosyltransferase, partial [Proteobacteria bacterium]|nr:glycosyltransferase [Pseudomonadota bacterium]
PRGVSATRNTGLDAVRGDYVSFLDDDDVYLPDHLRLSVEALEAHAGDFISAAYIAAFVERDVAGALTVHSLYVYDGVYNGLVMNVWQPVLVQSVVGRAALLRDVRFDPSLPVAEDFEFLIRLGRRGEFGYLLRPTWMITVYDEQGSLSTSNKYAEALRRVYALHPLENAPSLQAQREAQLQRYDTLGGHKEPWLPPLGRLPQRIRLDTLDDLRRKV